ncbi:hypothetical protein L228DRAFT_240434 [Xylona heveae TC161]|uniref:Uncharacterized protein n=1 Tax=Xylona heveae (strain CBS 132557 / TC161) TaxID=1328760 RepID=A0A165F793_XYLHT|nr:hypothetical protein L228DRAFT_240434 [Xylona heveae TC161]KZF20663.1 hypothetical protein L228DRAFT_240434 [Xylona heveae TC161]
MLLTIYLKIESLVQNRKLDRKLGIKQLDSYMDRKLDTEQIQNSVYDFKVHVLGVKQQDFCLLAICILLIIFLVVFVFIFTYLKLNLFEKFLLFMEDIKHVAQMSLIVQCKGWIASSLLM